MGYNNAACNGLFELGMRKGKMKIIHIVGNRPQFIKLAPVSRKMKEHHIDEVIVHTGQHYDENMSNIFFEELNIPQPKVNLNVGSGTHAQVTAKVISRLEEVVVDEKPDGVVIYGDTNSTLAAAIVVSKLNIPLFHIEAGPRTYSKTNPEEKNRIVADHLSDYLFVPDKISMDNLKREGIASKRIVFSGDVMYDQFLYIATHNESTNKGKYPDDFILMTWHRQENTSSKERMGKVLSFIEKIDYKIVLLLHPRTKKLFSEYKLWTRVRQNRNLLIMDPVGYKEMTLLLSHCKLLISDSGGVSKEASFAGKKCFFPLKLEVWPELISSGYINIVDVEDKLSVNDNIHMIEEIIYLNKSMPKVDCFGNGNAAEIIVDTIENVLTGC